MGLHAAFRSERLVKAKTPTSSPQTRTRYGTANPEQVENALWEQAIDEEWTGYGLRQHLGIDLDRNTFRLNFSHSAYRDATPGRRSGAGSASGVPARRCPTGASSISPGSTRTATTPTSASTMTWWCSMQGAAANSSSIPRMCSRRPTFIPPHSSAAKSS